MSQLLNKTFLFVARVIFALLFVFCSPGPSIAQRAVAAGFFSLHLITSAGADYSPLKENTPASAGVHFSPQLFLTRSYTDFSLSINPSPGILYSLSDTDRFSEKLFFQLPAMAHVNIGHLASKDFRSAFGFFAGAGWNLQFGHGGSTNGFAWDAGVRLWFLGQSFTIAYMQLPGHEKIFSSGHFFSLNINLGKYLSQVKANNKVTNFMKPYRNKK